MKQISMWSRNHRWPARFTIIISYIILNYIGLFLGDVLFLSGIIIPAAAIYASCFIFLVSFISYPSKKDKVDYKNFYRRQKLTDVVLIASTFLLIITLGNHHNTSKLLSQSTLAATPAFASTPLLSTLNKNVVKEKPSIKNKKGLKKLKQKLSKNVLLLNKEYKTATKTERTLLIILSVLIAAGLLLLVASLACGLSCSGSEGLAILVGVAGTALIIFLLVKVIKRIKHGKPEKKIPAATSA